MTKASAMRAIPAVDTTQSAANRLIRMHKLDGREVRQEFERYKRDSEVLTVSFNDTPRLSPERYDAQMSLNALDIVFRYADSMKGVGPRDSGVFMRGENDGPMDIQVIKALAVLSPSMIIQIYHQLDFISEKTHSMKVYRAVEDAMAPFHKRFSAKRADY